MEILDNINSNSYKGISRRNFVQTSAGFAASALLPSVFSSKADVNKANSSLVDEKLIGIQIGANAFIDEGVEKVMDILQERGEINTLFISTFTFSNTIGGPLYGNADLPDHGKKYESYFGGYFAKPNPEYYTDTVLKGFKAPDHGDIDILGMILPEAKKRGFKVYSFIYGMVMRNDVPLMEHLQEVNLDGHRNQTGCAYNPNYQNFVKGLTRDLCNSYEIDGLMWGAEYQGPLNNAIYATPGEWKISSPTCFCSYHRDAAKERGIDVDRAIEGYKKLMNFTKKANDGIRPINGYFIEFWGILIEYPEVIAWEKLWTDGHHSTYSDIYKTAKAARPEIQVGFHIWHTNTMSPFARAEQNFLKFANYADFLKTVSYNIVGGTRYAAYIENLGSAVFRDLPQDELLKLNNYFLNYENMPNLSELPKAGLPSDYVFRETKRALDIVEGKCKIYPGIEIDIPSKIEGKKTAPEDVFNSTTAALKAGAQGVIFSRNYSEMFLDNISGGGKAIKAFANIK